MDMAGQDVAALSHQVRITVTREAKMIANPLYWWKYLTGPTANNEEHWRMSDMRHVKYVGPKNECFYVLTFNDDDTCVLDSSTENTYVFKPVHKLIPMSTLLKTLKEEGLLENWKPTWLSYTADELKLLTA